MTHTADTDPDIELREGLVYRDPKLGGLHELVVVEDDRIVHDSWSDDKTRDGRWDERGRCTYTSEYEDMDRFRANLRKHIAEGTIIAMPTDADVGEQ